MKTVDELEAVWKAACTVRDRVATRQAQQQEREAWTRMIDAEVWRKEEE